MEFTSTAPPSLPSYRARCQAIVTLNNPHDHDSAATTGEPLGRTTSRGSIGSIGRRLSFGKGDGAEDKERGAGLRSFARRMSGEGKDGDATTGGSALGRTKSRDASGKNSITGKWATNVEVAVTPTHLILLLASEHPLAPFPPPPGAPGYKPRTSSTSHDAAEGGGIKDKIKGLFSKGHSSDAAADNTGKTSTPTPAVAPTPEQAKREFPAYVNGQATTCVMVPIGAIKESEVQLVDDKREIGLRVPITSHFSTLVHGMLDNIGKEQDESWGRSGKIKFDFDRNWIGAKGEAETLYNNITQAIFDRRNNPSGGDTLALGSGHGNTARQTGSAVPPTTTTTAAPATAGTGLASTGHQTGLEGQHSGLGGGAQNTTLEGQHRGLGGGSAHAGPGNIALGNPITHAGETDRESGLSGRKVAGDAL